MIKAQKFLLCVALLIGSSARITLAGGWSSNTIAEGVSDYSVLFSGSHQHDVAGADSATDFSNGLPSFFPTSNRTLWTNGNVWDTDMIDTDRSSSLTQISSNIGQDKYYFDSNGTAISYFAGHGECPYDFGPCSLGANCACSTSAQCQPGQQCQVPPVGQGVCHASNNAAAVTSSVSDSNGHRAWYGTSKQQMAFGEDSAPSGTWAGVGGVGGSNAVFFQTSCGAQPNYFWNNQRPMFAGLHLLATQMVVVGDTSGGYQWGSVVTAIARANPNAAMSQAWFDSMSQITVGGGPCPGNGGWNGYTGCGANLVVSWAANSSDASWHVSSESWSQIRQEDYDPRANTTAWAWYRCNYDCNTYPMTK